MENNQPKGLAITSMVLGIISIVPGWCIPYLPLILGLLAVIFGGVSIAKKQGGKGMAVAGLVTGIISLAIYAVVLLFVGAALTDAFSSL